MHECLPSKIMNTPDLYAPKRLDPVGAAQRVGIAADHGGFELKEFLAGKLRGAGYEVTDFGDRQLKSDDDYPDFIIPLARAVAAGTVDRGVGICGSGVGASIAANKP